MKSEIVLDKNLKKSQIDLMNKYRKIEFGKNEIKDFKKDYFSKARFFFLKEKNNI